MTENPRAQAVCLWGTRTLAVVVSLLAGATLLPPMTVFMLAMLSPLSLDSTMGALPPAPWGERLLVAGLALVSMSGIGIALTVLWEWSRLAKPASEVRWWRVWGGVCMSLLFALLATGFFHP